MPTPKINIGAHGGSNLALAAGQGAREAAEGIEKDYDAARTRILRQEKHDDDLLTSKVQRKNVRSIIDEREREFALNYTASPEKLAEQGAHFIEQFKNARNTLFTLREKKLSDEGLTEDEQKQYLMAESSIKSFMGIIDAEDKYKAAYKSAWQEGNGVSRLSSPRNRALAEALYGDGLEKSLDENGQWVYNGKITVRDVGENGELIETEEDIVNEPAHQLLNDLNLTKKTDWSKKIANRRATIPGEKRSRVEDDGRTVNWVYYDPKDLMDSATEDLSDDDAIDDYAFRYLTEIGGYSEKEARDRVNDLQTHGYGEFRDTLIQQYMRELQGGTQGRGEYRRDYGPTLGEGETYVSKEAPTPGTGGGKATEGAIKRERALVTQRSLNTLLSPYQGREGEITEEVMGEVIRIIGGNNVKNVEFDKGEKNRIFPDEPAVFKITDNRGKKQTIPANAGALVNNLLKLEYGLNAPGQQGGGTFNKSAARTKYNY